MKLDVTFEENAWDSYIRGLEDGDTVSGSYLLTLLEGESEDVFEDAFQILRQKSYLRKRGEVRRNKRRRIFSSPLRCNHILNRRDRSTPHPIILQSRRN